MANKPEETFRAGLVSASLFKNDRTVNGKKVSIPSITVQKRYQDDTGQWKTTNSYSLNDLPRLLLVVVQAYASAFRGQATEEEPADEPGQEE